MKGRIWIILGALAYATVLGCLMVPAPQPQTAQADSVRGVAPQAASRVNTGGMPYRGMVLQVQRIDGEGLEYKKAVDAIAELGADSIELVVDSRQENGSSGMIFLDMRMTPSAEKLTDLVKYAKTKKLRVIMMPIVLLEKPIGNEWRGTIKPPVWEEWFTSYREIVTHYAQIAEAGGADVFIVGSELVSTERFADEWRHTIHDIRQIFHGQLTYSANWDHYQNIPFWEDLDLIGMNSYWKLGENKDVSVDEIVRRWTNIQRDLFTFVHKMHRPLYFTEVGWCSLDNAAHEPWDYTKFVAVDLDLQKKLYEGFFRAWENKPELGGFSVWQYTIGQGGPQDRGYTPVGKPAEQVLRQWMAKPRWTVNPNS